MRRCSTARFLQRIVRLTALGAMSPTRCPVKAKPLAAALSPVRGSFAGSDGPRAIERFGENLDPPNPCRAFGALALLAMLDGSGIPRNFNAPTLSATCPLLSGIRRAGSRSGEGGVPSGGSLSHGLPSPKDRQRPKGTLTGTVLCMTNIAYRQKIAIKIPKHIFCERLAFHAQTPLQR